MACSHEHCGDYGHVGESAVRIIRASRDNGTPTIPANVDILCVLDMAMFIAQLSERELSGRLDVM